jgi:hypothetical protein
MHLLPIQNLLSVNKILQQFIQGMPNVKISISIWRSIVQYESFGTSRSSRIRKFLIEVRVFPELLNLRLTVLRICALGEWGLGKKDCGCIGILLLLGSLPSLLFLAFW